MAKEDTKRVVMTRKAWIDGKLVGEHSVIEVPKLLALELFEGKKAVEATPDSEKAAKAALAAAEAEREKAAKAAPEKRG